MSNTIFFATTLAMFRFQPTVVFHLVATLCKDGNTMGMSTRPIDESRIETTLHNVPKAN
jgi:hypothetical protein